MKNKLRPPGNGSAIWRPPMRHRHPFQILHEHHNGKAAAHPMIKKRSRWC